MTKLSPNNPYLSGGGDGRTATAVKPMAAATPKAKKDRNVAETKKDYVCQNANCGYRGKMHRVRKGDWVLFVVFFLLGALPGILYVIFGMGYKVVCPECNQAQKV